jgi:hypothetical protein
LGAGVGAGFLVELGYAAAGDRTMEALAVLLMVSVASLVSGGFLGFLFGVPRALAARAGEGGQGERATRYGANTNLEQISDWLTKILLGAGLTQLGNIGQEFRRLVSAIAPAVGPEPTNVPITGGLLVYFTIGGFIAGWLTTRLLLAPALSRADQAALDRFVEAQFAEISGDLDRADALRGEAIQYLRPEAESLARRYEDSRELPPGPLRTAEMESIVNAARQAATSPDWTAQQVRQLFNEGSAGARIFALGLMQGNPALAEFATVLAAIDESKSAFEQYEGLILARMMLDSLDESQRQLLHDSVSVQLGRNGWIRTKGARWTTAQSIIARLEARQQPSTTDQPAG